MSETYKKHVPIKNITLLKRFANIWLRLLACFHKVKLSIIQTSEKPGNTEDNTTILIPTFIAMLNISAIKIIHLFSECLSVCNYYSTGTPSLWKYGVYLQSHFLAMHALTQFSRNNSTIITFSLFNYTK